MEHDLIDNLRRILFPQDASSASMLNDAIMEIRHNGGHVDTLTATVLSRVERQLNEAYLLFLSYDIMQAEI